MANNYNQSSSFLSIPKEKIHLVSDILLRAELKAQKKVAKDMGDSNNYEIYSIDCDIEILDDGVWFYHDESFRPESAELIARTLINELDLDTVFYCSWAYTCTKLRTDEFGGGAFVIKKDHPTIWVDALSYVMDKLK